MDLNFNSLVLFCMYSTYHVLYLHVLVKWFYLFFYFCYSFFVSTVLPPLFIVVVYYYCCCYCCCLLLLLFIVVVIVVVIIRYLLWEPNWTRYTIHYQTSSEPLSSGVMGDCRQGAEGTTQGGTDHSQVSTHYDTLVLYRQINILAEYQWFLFL